MWTTGTASHIIPIFVWTKHMCCGNVTPTRKGIPVLKEKTNRGNCKTAYTGIQCWDKKYTHVNYSAWSRAKRRLEK